jgi:NAD-dependent deacetylase
LVWRWYHWRRGLIAQCRPNPAHTALSQLENRVGEFTLITQNVDGLHRLAGSRHVLEIHGSIWTVRCLDCGSSYQERALDLPALPPCRECGGTLRPAVVWFGESLDAGLLAQAWAAAQNCRVMLVVGTSALVQPAASLAEVAAQAGAFVIEVNLEPTPNSDWVDISLHGPAGRILPQLLEPT